MNDTMSATEILERTKKKDKNPTLGFFDLTPGQEIPKPATKGSACFDLRFQPTSDKIKGFNKDNKPIERDLGRGNTDRGTSQFYLTIMPGDRFLVPIGFILDIPEGYSVRIHPRSSLSYKKGLNLANSEGVIDSDYVDPLFALITNITETPAHIEVGERIIQGELVKTETFKVSKLNKAPEKKTDRDGGYGSTGK